LALFSWCRACICGALWHLFTPLYRGTVYLWLSLSWLAKVCSARLSPSPSHRRSLEAHIAPVDCTRNRTREFSLQYAKENARDCEASLLLGVSCLYLYPLHPTVMPAPKLPLSMRGTTMKTTIRAPPNQPRKTKRLQQTLKRSISLKRSACAGLNGTGKLATQGKTVAGRHNIENGTVIILVKPVNVVFLENLKPFADAADIGDPSEKISADAPKFTLSLKAPAYFDIQSEYS
jgi:hypothetical protein